MVIGDGRKIKIKFTQPLIGNVDGLNPPLTYIQSKLDLSKATFSALNQYSSSNSASHAFDGNTSSYWRGTTAVNWIKVKLAEPKVVTSFRLYMGSYYISTFTISGSNDGGVWTQIGGVFSAATSTTSQWYDFELENKTEYLYYKLDTLTTYGSRVYLFEWELYEAKPLGNESKFEISFDTYDYLPGGTLSRQTKKVESFEANNSFHRKLNLEEGALLDCRYEKGQILLGLREVTEDG